ncbi:hypothetical protein [Flagellimonas abyssi]|uniref:DUF559 domain-containing protein n=1 Tax=Flagellimonas abyssi TaxID=2864871 RepID=A0ABS7EWA6_9FLAO|nr:hypothetical protein [Allomuricauda abyssi]MBW8201893.1 hypothetical protein [Allomuricauda abyssi]
MTLDLGSIDLSSLIRDSITLDNRTNLFLDLRRLFLERIYDALEKNHIEIGQVKMSDSTKLLGGAFTQVSPIKAPNGALLDIDFCARYGHDFHSLGSINYQFGLFSAYYTLETFRRNEGFSLGNFIVPLKTREFDFLVKESDEIKIVGYSADMGPKKRKPFIALVGVHFDHQAVQKVISDLIDQMDDRPILDEVCFSTMSYPMMFTCRKSGKLFTCTCFENHIDWQQDFYRFTPKLEHYDFIKRQIMDIRYKDGICHLCTGTVPQLEYGNSMYHSSFLIKFLPYQYLMNKKRSGSIFSFNESDNKVSENELRARFGFYGIGERWTTETLLFRILDEIFHGTEVVFHYRGKELGGLELDIWIPEYRLGVEYQGIQHFKAIEYWGGTENLERQKRNDQKKKEICKTLGYRLMEFFYDEEITKDLVLGKLRKAGIQIN